jgi:hypothetical protein
VAEARAERGLAAALTAFAALCACLLAGCGNGEQSKTLSASSLEPLVANQEFPIFWLGGRFDGLALTQVVGDPSGAYEMQYGACAIGGPETCIPPLAVISSPDNSFTPGAGAISGAATIRGVHAILTEEGRTIALATGTAAVDIRAKTRALALAAADRMVAINQLGTPAARLAAAQPNTGYAGKPLEGQQPQTVQGLPASSR